MDYNKILSVLDHTLLGPTATWKDVQAVCQDAVDFGVASVCIPPCYVRDAAAFLAGRLPICTTISFPHGNSATGTKLFEAKTAIMDGATEVDMIINLGYLKSGRFDKIFSEVSGIKAMIGETNTLKVIVETGLLTEEEKVRMCVLCEQAGANYIGTSTGFLQPCADPEDVALFTRHRALYLKIKGCGGIQTLEEAQRLLEAGADRLGSSRIIALLKQQGYVPQQH